jgi:hypothetical protein
MNPRSFFNLFILLTCLIGTSCGPAAQAGTEQGLETTLPVTDTPGIALADSMRLRVRLATTSDWTDLFLVSGVSWQSHELVSAAVDGVTAEAEAGHLLLSQPFLQAEAGVQAEMTVEVLISDPQAGVPVVFRIERGDIGATRVEFSRLAGGYFTGSRWRVKMTRSSPGA